jgi:hypothetical protein
MSIKQKTAIIYKGSLVLSPEHFLNPALRSSSFYLARDTFTHKHLAATQPEEMPDIRLNDGDTLYIVSQTKEGKSANTAKLCGLLELFRQGVQPKAKDAKNYAFKDRVKPEHRALLQTLAENGVEALLVCRAIPANHTRLPAVETLALQD